LRRVYKRIAKGMDVLEYYANTQWYFDKRKATAIKCKMNELEQARYRMDIEGVNIRHYLENGILGGRRYLMKTPDDKLPSAHRMMKV